jgi:hypothetical protein
VGNMVFDPGQICWESILPPEEDEPDIFANLAEDSDVWESKGDTIRAIVSRVSDVSAQAPHQMPGRALPVLRVVTRVRSLNQAVTAVPER